MKMPLLSLFSLMLALSGANALAADLSCARQMGEQRATLLAKQCRQVSGATHPPCNASNSCAMMVEHVTDSCSLLGVDGEKIKICKPVERSGVFQGYLFSGAGTDAVNISVMTEQGDRVFAYCGQKCSAAMFDGPDENDVVTLKKSWIGMRVEVEIKIERNAGRIAGPGDSERIPLVQRIKKL